MYESWASCPREYLFNPDYYIRSTCGVTDEVVQRHCEAPIARRSQLTAVRSIRGGLVIDPCAGRPRPMRSCGTGLLSGFVGLRRSFVGDASIARILRSQPA